MDSGLEGGSELQASQGPKQDKFQEKFRPVGRHPIDALLDITAGWLVVGAHPTCWQGHYLFGCNLCACQLLHQACWGTMPNILQA